MKLYLVQHGEAIIKEVDPSRPLTDKGRAEVLKLAGFLKQLNLNIDTIWHSRKRRAIQTAQALSESLRPSQGLIERQDLAPNDPPEKLQGELQDKDLDLMIVGHLPFLQKLASLLLTNLNCYELIGFRQAGVVCLQRKDRESWQLEWMIIPELISF